MRKSIKIGIIFYTLLFGVQLGFYVFAPSFYVSSPDQLTIPNFILWTFAKYFSVIFLLYLAWGALLGLWNGWVLKFNQAQTPRKTKPLWALQTAQFLAILLLLSVLYPAILGRYPGLRQLPLAYSYALMGGGIVLLAIYFLKSRTQAIARGIPQVLCSLLLPVGVLTLLLRPTPLNFPAAQATSPAEDILLLGVDALDGDTGNTFLEKRLQGQGAVIFTNAFTPLPLTHPSWNSILSGLYPKHHGVRYFFESPLESKNPELFLPTLLKQQKGYQTLFASDQPETSYFTQQDGFDQTVLHTIGWEAHMVGMILNHFILPSVWLNNAYVELWTGTSFNHASLYNYDLGRFFNQSFRRLQQMGPSSKLMALHTCYLHSPIQLNRQELTALKDPWNLSPQDFSFQKWPKPGVSQKSTHATWINPYFIRRQSALTFLDQLLKELEEKNYLKKSIVVILSDHGERFIKGREIYGGVHGVDLQTREQSNVVFTLMHPKQKSLKVETKPVSLIDVAPTILSQLKMDPKKFSFDGIALLDGTGQPISIPKRAIWMESMGYLKDPNGQVEFPQIPVQILEASLQYGESGTVTIGKDYYGKIIQEKEFLDLSRKKDLLTLPQ